MAAIEFRDYSFQYRSQSTETIKQINLTIHEGEKVLLIGASGSGKSTLASCVNGLIPFSYTGDIRGQLLVNGKEAKALSLFQLSTMVGTVLQDPDGQFIGLTVAEDIAFALENDCREQAYMREQVRKSAELVGIETHLSSAPNEVSGGQKQRVTLAGVMVDHVDILLFDEPLASLDPATGKQAIALIEEIHRKTGVTVLIIEHRLEDVLPLHPDRIIVIDDGEIICDAAPDALLATDILRQRGLREPLYISALKYAGADLHNTAYLHDITQMPVEPFTAALRQFAETPAPPPPTPRAETALEVCGLSFAYDGAAPRVLTDVGFAVKKGEMLSIVGKNGAGKTTLAKLICGFMQPTAGRIAINDQDIRGKTISECAELVGYVMQNPNEMISCPMIFDEVALGLRSRGITDVEERVNETLRVCGLYPFRNWPVQALSYGQKKRVTIASILVLRPAIIILDEPTAGQDFKHYTEIMEFLCELNRLGTTIIMVTHDMHLMLEYTRRALVLTDGRLLSDGTSVEAQSDASLITAANLKETSLFTLAVRAGLPDPLGFVWRFIERDRANRAEAHAAADGGEAAAADGGKAAAAGKGEGV